MHFFTYGVRFHPVLRTVKMHTGIDYAAPSGTPIKAPADGEIVFKGWKGGYGNTVMLQHSNGVETLYTHMSAFSRPAAKCAPVKSSAMWAAPAAPPARICIMKPASTANR